MSSSYYETLGRDSLSPRSSQLTMQEHFGLKESADMAPVINEEIDRQTRRNDQYFNLLIEQYNHLHDRAAKYPKELAGLTKQGVDLTKQTKAFIKDQAEYNEFASRFTNSKQLIKQVVDGDQWRVYQDLANTDKDVAQYNKTEPLLNQVQTLGVEAAVDTAKISPENTEAPQRLMDGPNGSYAARHGQIKSAKQFWGMYTNMHKEMQAGMRVELPAHIAPPNPDGSLQVTTWKLSSGVERDYIDQVIDAWIYHKHKDVLGGPLGLFKRDTVTYMMKERDDRYNKYKREESAANAKVWEERRAEDLAIRIESDPNYLITYINMYKGFHDGRKDLARQEAFRHIELAYATGKVSRETIENMLNHQFEAADSTEENPHIVTVRDYWKKDVNKLLKKIREHDNNEQAAIKEERDHKGKLWVNDKINEIYESKEPISWKAKQDLINQYMSEFQVSYEQVPDKLKDLYTKGTVPDRELNLELIWRQSRGETLSTADLVGFEDPILKKKWMGEVTGIGIDSTRRDSFITGRVNDKTLEQDASKDKTTKWRAYKDNATIHFNKAFRAAIAQGATEEEAFKAGIDRVEKGLDVGGKGDTSWSEWGGETQPKNEIRDMNRVKEALSKDPTLIDSKQPWVGEEPHLKEALIYHKNVLAGRGGQMPIYYKQFTGGLKITPGKLLRRRLYAVGLIKENETVIPEDELTPATRELFRKPNPSKTLRALNTDDGITMIDAKKFDFRGRNEETLQEDAVQELRAKAQTSQQYALIDSSYRTLVNIPQELNDQFIAQVGDLPPYLQLNNLAPEVAKALIGDTLMT